MPAKHGLVAGKRMLERDHWGNRRGRELPCRLDYRAALSIEEWS